MLDVVSRYAMNANKNGWLKVLLMVYFVPANGFWAICLFFLAWGAADSGPEKELTVVITEELQRGNSIMV
jgi:hypothetical protein